MAQNTITVRGTRASVRKKIVEAVKAASGNSVIASQVAKQMQIRLGMTALARIRDAFVVKSKGGTDDCGLKWPALSPKTIAYSRRHPGVPQSKERAPFRPSWMLSDKQREKWWRIYRQGLARFKGDKIQAAKFAWSVLKGDGAKTLLSEYGNTAVLILRDTGLLLNSLSPGVEPGLIEDQVFKIGEGDVIVGTNRKHAAAHHHGIPGKLPQRRLWAEPSEWPQEWWSDLQDQARAGYIDIVTFILRNGL